MSTQEAYKAELQRLQQGFASNIRGLRKGSQGELADAANLHRTEVGELEAGKRNPSLHTLLILADALGLTLNDLAKDLPVPHERSPSPQALRAAKAQRAAETRRAAKE